MPNWNEQGGLDADSKPELKRAQRADLVTLPLNTIGTNCGNCRFVRDTRKVPKLPIFEGVCAHPQVDQPVTSRMCCVFWDAKGTLRAWKE